MRCLTKYMACLCVLLAGASFARAEGVPTLAANEAANIQTNGGVPLVGFTPLGSSFSAKGCEIHIAGGNMGTRAQGADIGGANFAMDCDERDGEGSWFRIHQNDNANQPHEIFACKRLGFCFAQGFGVMQGGYSSGYPRYKYYYQNFDKTNSSSATDWATFGVFTDVPSAKVPIFSIWGLTNAVYPGSRPPLYQHYCSTWINAALYNATIGLSPMDGTKCATLEDNGNQFSNMLTRTTAAFTNATTSLANVTGLGVPVMNGRTYAITGKIYITSATGGVKFAVNSTSTASYVIYQVTCLHNTGPAISSSGQSTSLGSAVAAASTSLSGGGLCDVSGTVTISSGGSRTLAATTTSGSATVTMASTTGLVVGQQVTQIGTGSDALPGGAFITAIVAGTSITLDRNASASYTGNLNFWDTVSIQAASNAAGTLTVAQGSSLWVGGSINGGAY